MIKLIVITKCLKINLINYNLKQKYVILLLILGYYTINHLVMKFIFNVVNGIDFD